MWPRRKHFEEEWQALLAADRRRLRKGHNAETYRALLELQAKRAARDAGEEWQPKEGRP